MQWHLVLFALTLSSAMAVSKIRYQLITSGTCLAAGGLPINIKSECENAARQLGLISDTSARSTTSVPRPEGCYWYRGSVGNELWISTGNKGNGYSTDGTNTREPLCKFKELYATAQIGEYPGGRTSLSDKGISTNVSGKVNAVATLSYLSITGTIHGLEANTKGGIHVHSGTTCNNASLVGGHWHDISVGDPWLESFWISDSSGVAVLAINITAEDLGYDPTLVSGRAVVAHDSNGTSAGCGLLIATVTETIETTAPKTSTCPSEDIVIKWSGGGQSTARAKFGFGPPTWHCQRRICGHGNCHVIANGCMLSFEH